MASPNFQTGLDDVTPKYSFLKNPDLKAITFSHLQFDNRSLLNAALTCKDFQDLALDVLWEELDSLVPLLKLLPTLQVEDDAYVLSGNVSHADWDRLQYYSRKVKIFETSFCDERIHVSTYVRIAQLQSSALFPSLRQLHCWLVADSFISHIFLFLSPLLDSVELINIEGLENTVVGPFLDTLSSSPQMLRRIVLRSGRMSVDILKKSIVHFKQLRYLNLSVAVPMSDFVLWEVLGSLPSLADLTLVAIDPASHPGHAPENPNSQSGGPKYFDALESLRVTGSFFFIQHLLGFIDSPCLKTIKVYPVIIPILNEHDREPDNLFSLSMTIVASKWSQSLTDLDIDSRSSGSAHRFAIPKSLAILTDFHKMQTLLVEGWKVENVDDDVSRPAVMSWPKLRMLRDLTLTRTLISLSALRIIAEKCPELHRFDIDLDASTILPFDTSSPSLGHKLEILSVGSVHSSITQISLECQIQIARHLDLIFPYLKTIEIWDPPWRGIHDLFKLCQDIRLGQ